MNQRHCDLCDAVIDYRSQTQFFRVETQVRDEFDELSDTHVWDVCLDCVAKHSVLLRWCEECREQIRRDEEVKTT
jgi:hypothetical protein